ncbi:hypothetical protein [Aquimarina macrocephali]|uniref:hypothetical protein n=1 Tax=Aquimarina macrocephali TaxID=666563 RepID=UPI000465BF13|nr:hypothetical protein [Aquimarina macrocephali]
MNKSNYVVRDNLRLCVIENSILIETAITILICTKLNIEPENSKSFGNGSSSLSFSQKIQIMQDIQGLEKELVKKLSCLTNIRNKFAHVGEVSDFEKFFQISKNGKELRNSLHRWYSSIHSENSSDFYRKTFYSLVDDINNSLQSLGSSIGQKIGKSLGEILLYEMLVEEVKLLPNSKNIFDSVQEKYDARVADPNFNYKIS